MALSDVQDHLEMSDQLLYKEIHMTAILHLRSITCLQQAETFTDELYVTFNGTKRSLPDMTQGRTKTLNDEFLFVGSPQLSLFENDGDHWYDRDDFIAKHTITESPADLTLDFKATSGNALPAHYALSVSITPDPPIQMTAILRLRSITCLQQAETFTDELYVTFNGTKRSLPDMTQGQTKTLNDEFLFVGSPLLSLFENDGDHWYDRDDFIAKHTITGSPADLTLDFKATSGHAVPAHYELSVSITPGP
jgi:ribosomal protein S17E